MEALSQAYRALGDATRLRILRLVAQTPLNVSEIVSLVGIAQPTVSHHLGKLKAMRLLLEERQGVFTYYSLDLHPDDPRWPLIRVAIDDRTDGDGDLARLRDLLRQRDDRQALNERLLDPPPFRSGGRLPEPPLPRRPAAGGEDRPQAAQEGRAPAGARVAPARRGVGPRAPRPSLPGIRPGRARRDARGGGIRLDHHRDPAQRK